MEKWSLNVESKNKREKFDLDNLEVGDYFKYFLDDAGIFQVVEKEEGAWIVTIRINNNRKSGEFRWTKVYPISDTLVEKLMMKK